MLKDSLLTVGNCLFAIFGGGKSDDFFEPTAEVKFVVKAQRESDVGQLHLGVIGETKFGVLDLFIQLVAMDSDAEAFAEGSFRISDTDVQLVRDLFVGDVFIA